MIKSSHQSMDYDMAGYVIIQVLDKTNSENDE